MNSVYIVHEASPYAQIVLPEAYKTFKEATDALEQHVKKMKYFDEYAEEVSTTVDALWQQTLQEARVDKNVTNLYIEKEIFFEIHCLPVEPTFEIIVFEYQDLYDGASATKENVVERFLTMCRRYIDPWCVPKAETELLKTRHSIMYKDRSGSDKYKMIQLIGPVTEEMLAEIRKGIDNFYINHCEDCGVETPMNRGICQECAV